MEGVERGDAAFIKMAGMWCYGKAESPKNYVDLPELRNCHPLEKHRVLAELTADGKIDTVTASQLSGIISQEIESGQLKLLATMIKRMETENPLVVLKDMRPQLELLSRGYEDVDQAIKSSPNITRLEATTGQPVVDPLG